MRHCETMLGHNTSQDGRRHAGVRQSRRLPWLCVALLPLAAATGPGCDANKQPRRPPPDPSASQTPAPEPMPRPLPEPALPLGGRSQPVLSKAALRHYRVELCYFGLVGLEVAREAYWQSLGAEEPSDTNVPSFGSYPEYKRRSWRRGEPSLAEKMGRLPFDGHVRSCATANRQQEATHKELGAALAQLAAYTSVLSKAVFDAARYYARGEYQRDGFKRGRKLHEQLSDELSKLDDAVAQFRPAFASWLETRAALPEAGKLDRGGLLAAKALDAARILARALLEPPRDSDAVAKALAATHEASEALSAYSKAHTDAKHPKMVAPKVAAFLETTEGIAKVERKLTPTQRYAVSSAFLGVLEANHRATIQLLRGDEADPYGRGPSRLTPPQRRAPQPHRPVKPKMSAKPKTPTKP